MDDQEKKKLEEEQRMSELKQEERAVLKVKHYKILANKQGRPGCTIFAYSDHHCELILRGLIHSGYRTEVEEVYLPMTEEQFRTEELRGNRVINENDRDRLRPHELNSCVPEPEPVRARY